MFIGPALQGARLIGGASQIGRYALGLGSLLGAGLTGSAAQPGASTSIKNRPVVNPELLRPNYSGAGERARRFEEYRTGNDIPGANTDYSVRSFRPLGGTPEERAQAAEISRVAQLTAQDPELKRYEIAAAKARKPGATEQDIQSAEDIGMAMWAKANPKLAAKVKPGQSGYEVIQNELNAGQMGPVTNFPFDTTRPLSPTPIPPEQRAVTYEGVKPVTLEGVTPIVGGGFPTEQAAMFERFQQSIAPNKPSFQGSPLGTATPLVGNLSYTGSITPIGTTAVQGGDFRSEQARKLAEMFKNAQFSS